MFKMNKIRNFQHFLVQNVRRIERIPDFCLPRRFQSLRRGRRRFHNDSGTRKSPHGPRKKSDGFGIGKIKIRI
jgi:hypothetical protein